MLARAAGAIAPLGPAEAAAAAVARPEGWTLQDFLRYPAFVQ
jgi:hypothetical protein